MASSHNVELEAAKFLHKLIQDSKDEPAKLATKLYVILQHMKSSGKEHSMPYQVISRAMETVIKQHGLDIEALKSSRLPSAGGTQPSDSATTQFGGSSQTVGVAKDSKVGLPENEVSKIDSFASSRPPVGPSSAGHDYFQGPSSHRNSQSFDHESPSSLDSRSANSQSQERRDTANWDKQVNQKDGKKTTTKRKRGDTSVPTEPHNDNPQQLDSRNTVVNTRKGKMSKVESSSGFAIKGGEHANFNILQSSSPMEQFPSLSGSMRPVIRSKQEGQHLIEKQLDPANVNNSLSRAPNLKYPEETEVSSTHNPLSQQQVPSVPHDIMGVWNQNKVGLQLEKSQVPRFPSNVVLGNAEISLPSAAPSIGTGSFGKVQGGAPVASSSFPTAEAGFSSAMQFGGPILTAGKVLEHDGGNSNKLADAGKLAQAGRQNSVSEMTMLRSAAPRDAGKSPVLPLPVNSGMPFKEQQLKQLRAQCLVFLAFRNGLMPKKLHLEIALGNIFPKEGGSAGADGSRKELVDHKGKVPFSTESNPAPDMMPFGRMNSARETDKIPSGAFFKEAGNLKVEDRSGPAADHLVLPEDRKHLQTSRKHDVEMQTPENSASQACLTMASPNDSSAAKSGLAFSAPGDKMENGHQQVGRSNPAVSLVAVNKQMNPEIVSWTAVGNHDEVSRGVLPASALQHELKDNAPSQIQNHSNTGSLGNHLADNNLSSFSLRDRWKPVSGIDHNHHTVLPLKDANMMPKHVSQEQFEEDNLVPADLPPSPKYTMSEKWIMDHQKRKFFNEQKWVLKQQKTKQRIAKCFYKLKENVSSSEDISARTKSVIELKKLQLLELQRRLRSDFLNDFFKPINTEIDRVKSFKKHKHGRRVRQLEKFELKMKEERQKRIRERQKEFFGEIEVHKERLDDIFKFKRERWKVFNKYAKEFHKRKERIHREKIDRIQREKINLLKINDVEGYLRMVQDAKSDRVKQLLKETEKYLQKLGSKLQEAKSMATQFERDMDEKGTVSFIENSEAAIENDDESDQAKHYLESNEKYYLMAHSIKESIAEQPSILQGGKLREYQMNGLRWLVSLYNNHLNGILADEMGLGKTVQVISLICYLMETKNDRGPFLVVVPSSVLPGWESEINFWAPSVHKIVYAGPPEERRRLFKEKIVHQKFNVLLTTYEYLMNKHDRPKLSKVHWHYIIIDEGHRIKNASCKLNSDLKHYQSSHRLLLTGTPLQNNLDELWALLNFLLPNIFNSSEDFSQWFNKPFQSNGDNSPDEALLSEEENLLIINRLHQVLRPFVLRRLKHKVENQLPEKIERLIRCEASAYQKLLMKRVEDNLGSIGSSRARSVHNSVMELRNICNHPYLSQLHAEEVDGLIPKHYLPPIIRLCGKLEMLDRLLPKLKATDHRVLFFSTMTRLLDVMEEYLNWKQYRYLRLDGHTSGGDRGALIDKFNQSNSPFFIFLLSIRAGGVGVNLQAADTVIIFDTDWNPQVDLQAQARAHRIGQKRDVLVLRFETVQTVEEQVRAAAEHKLGVANQSITAGFFDNNTSAEDRREYLEALLRESKKEEAAPVLDDDALNDILARSESEIDVFESVDKQRRETEMATWRKLVCGQGTDNSETLPPPPSRLVTEDDLKEFYEAMKIYEVPKADVASNVGVKRKGEYLGGLDTQQYGRGKRTREVRSYEEQWTEEEFEKMCQVDSPGSPSKPSPSKPKEEVRETKLPTDASQAVVAVVKTELPVPPIANAPKLPTDARQAVVAVVKTELPAPPVANAPPPVENAPLPVANPLPPVVQPPHLQQGKDVTPPAKRGRGRPKRVTTDQSPGAVVQTPSGSAKVDTGLPRGTTSSSETTSCSESLLGATSGTMQNAGVGIASSQPVTPPSITPSSQSSNASSSVPSQVRGQGRRSQSGAEAPRRRGKKQVAVSPAGGAGLVVPDPKPNELTQDKPIQLLGNQVPVISGTTSSVPAAQCPDSLSGSTALQGPGGTDHHSGVGVASNSPQVPIQPVVPVTLSSSPSPSVPVQMKGQSRKTQSGGSGPRRRGKKQALMSPPPPVPGVSAGEELKPTLNSQDKSDDTSKGETMKSKQENAAEPTTVIQEQLFRSPAGVAAQDLKSTEKSVDVAEGKKQTDGSSTIQVPALAESQSGGVCIAASVVKESLPENCSSKTETSEHSRNEVVVAPASTVFDTPLPEVVKNQNLEDKTVPAMSTLNSAAPAVVPSSASFPSSTTTGGSQSTPPCPAEAMPVKRPGRKTPSRAEAPRRRGKKQAPILSALPDGSAGQNPNLSSQLQNKSVDTVGNKSTALRSKPGTDVQEVNQAQTGEVHLTTGLPGHDPKRKDQSSYTPQTKLPTNPPTAIDGAAGFNDKASVFGRIQTTDVNDVARVMKEVFSGTCMLKTKTSVSHGKEGKVAHNVPLTSKTVPEVAKNPSSEDKVNVFVSTSERAAAVSDLPVKNEKQTGGGAVTKAEGANTSVSNENPVCTTNVKKPEIKITAGYSEKMADPGQLSLEDASKEDSTDAAPLLTGENDANLSQVQSPAADPLLTLGGNLNSSLESETTVGCMVVPDGSGNKTEPLSKESPKASNPDASEPIFDNVSENSEKPDLSSHGSPQILEKPDNVGDDTIVTASISQSPHDSSVTKPHCTTETNSGNEVDPASEESRKPSIYNRNLENPTTTAMLDHSSAAKLGKAYLNKIDLPSVETEAIKCSGETIVAGTESSSKAGDLGVGLESSDTAFKLHDASSTERNLETPQVDIGDKPGTTLESVNSAATESGTMELIPKDHVGVPLLQEVQSTADGSDEVCSMQVDPSEGDKSNFTDVRGTISGKILDVSDVGDAASEKILKKMSLPLSPLATEEKVDYSKKSPVGSPVAVAEEKGSYAESIDQLGVSNSGDFVSGSTSEALPASSMDGEGKVEGSHEKDPLCSSASKDSEAEINVLFGSSKDGEILPEKTPEPAISLLLGQNPSEEDQGCSLEPAEELKDSKPDMDIQFGCSTSEQNLPEKSPEPSSFVSGEKTGYPSKEGPACSLVNAEDLKDSQADIDIQFESPSGGEIFPDKTLEPSSSLETGREKIECSSEKGTVCSALPVEESNDSGAEIAVDLSSNNPGGDLLEKITEASSSEKGAEIDVQHDSCIDGGVQPEKILEPSSSLETAEKIGCPSESSPVCSSVPLEEPKALEADMVVQLESCKDGGGLPEKIVPGLSSCVVTSEEKIEGSPEQDVARSTVPEEEMIEGSQEQDVPLEETQDSKAENDVQPLEDGEHSDEKIVQTDSSQVGNIEEEKSEASANFSVQLVESKAHSPPSSSMTEEEKIESSSERGPANLSEQPEGFKDLEASMENTMEARQVVGDVPENMGSETLDLPSSSLVSKEEIIEGSSGKDLVNSSGPLNESKDSEVDIVDGVDASVAGGILPGNSSQLMNTSLSSLAMEEGDIGIGSSVELAELEVSKEVTVQRDVSHVDQVSPQNMAENVVRSSSPTEVSIENFTEKCPVDSSVVQGELKMSEAEVSDEMDASMVGDFDTNNMSETVVPTTSSQEVEEKIKDSMEESPGGSSLLVEKISQEVEEKIKDSSESAEGSSVPVKKSDGNGAEVDHQMEKPEHGRSSLKEIISEKVDLPLSTVGNEEIECSSEKNQASSSVTVVEVKGSDAGINDQMDLPLSTVENEEIECSSEKNQASSSVAVVEVKGSDAGINDQMDASQASPKLPENDTRSDIDVPASSILMEAKKFEGKEDFLGSSAVLEASQGNSTEPVNPVDDSEGRVVSDIISENIDDPQGSSAMEGNNNMTRLAGIILAPEKSDSEVKAGVSSLVCDTVPECKNIDHPPESDGDNDTSMGLADSIKAPEKSDSEVEAGVASLICETLPVPECENKDLPSCSSSQVDANVSIIAPEKSDSEVKAGVASPVCETLPVPECENKDLPSCSSSQVDANVSVIAPEKSDSEVKAGVASPVRETLPGNENKDLPPCLSTQADDTVNESPEEGPIGSSVRSEETEELKD